MKKIYLNIVFQFFAISLIVSIFFLNDLSFEKILIFFQPKVFYLLLFIVLIKFISSIIFFNIIKIITNKKNNFISIVNTFIQGGIVNQLLPGAGILFKYYKFKLETNLTLAQYTVSQSILSIMSIISYFLLSIIFGFINFIELNFTNFFLFFSLLIFALFIIFLLKKKIITAIKNIIKKVKSLSKILDELKIIKNLIRKKIKTFILIFIFILLKSFLECLAFYYAIVIYDTSSSFVQSAYLYLSSYLLTIITFVNFIGIFEIILTISASFITNNYIDILFVGLGFNILNNLSLFILIAVFFVSKFIIKKW